MGATSRTGLLGDREQLAEWLDRERGLRLKDPTAEARQTGELDSYLGYLVSRRGFDPGERMRQRVAGHVEGKGPEALRESVQAMAAAWLWP